MAADAHEFYVRTRADWRQWLLDNHAIETSVWLVFDKGKDRTLNYDEIVEEALCFGWVDSVGGSVDDKRTKLYISRRKPKSGWAKTNKERVERLRAQGLMTPAGEVVIAIAKQNGAWDALTKSDNLEQPPELVAALSANSKAKTFWDTMPPSSHRLILEWIYSAKTEPTKLKRIQETVDLAAQGIKAHHYRQ